MKKFRKELKKIINEYDNFDRKINRIFKKNKKHKNHKRQKISRKHKKRIHHNDNIPFFSFRYKRRIGSVSNKVNFRKYQNKRRMHNYMTRHNKSIKINIKNKADPSKIFISRGYNNNNFMQTPKLIEQGMKIIPNLEFQKLETSFSNQMKNFLPYNHKNKIVPKLVKINPKITKIQPEYLHIMESSTTGNEEDFKVKVNLRNRLEKMSIENEDDISVLKKDLKLAEKELSDSIENYFLDPTRDEKKDKVSRIKRRIQYLKIKQSNAIDPEQERIMKNYKSPIILSHDLLNKIITSNKYYENNYTKPNNYRFSQLNYNNENKTNSSFHNYNITNKYYTKMNSTYSSKFINQSLIKKNYSISKYSFHIVNDSNLIKINNGLNLSIKRNKLIKLVKIDTPILLLKKRMFISNHKKNFTNSTYMIPNVTINKKEKVNNTSNHQKLKILNDTTNSTIKIKLIKSKMSKIYNQFHNILNKIKIDKHQLEETLKDQYYYSKRKLNKSRKLNSTKTKNFKHETNIKQVPVSSKTSKNVYKNKTIIIAKQFIKYNNSNYTNGNITFSNNYSQFNISKQKSNNLTNQFKYSKINKKDISGHHLKVANFIEHNKILGNKNIERNDEISVLINRYLEKNKNNIQLLSS